MAFKNVRNLLLINHNDGFINDDEFVALYDLYASKNLDFPYDSYAPFDLEELDKSESFAEFRFGKRDIRLPNGLIGNLYGPVGKLQKSTGHQL